MTNLPTDSPRIADRFRGFLPVVVDVETGGFDPSRHAILELAAVLVDYEGHDLVPGRVIHHAVQPLEGTAIEEASLTFTGIDLDDPDRGAIPEADALKETFRAVRKAVRDAGCTRAILVAHNAAFDLQFVHAGAARCGIKRNPFHPFSFIDTASLAAVAFGHTVLSEVCERAGITFDNRFAHAARYDAVKTAEVFCEVVNRWQRLGGEDELRAGNTLGG